MALPLSRFSRPLRELVDEELDRLKRGGLLVDPDQLLDLFHSARDLMDDAAISEARDELIAVERKRLGESYLTNYPAPLRFLFADYWLLRAVGNAASLGLHLEASPLSILDLGTGCGYFLTACKSMGHSILGVDAPIEYLNRINPLYSQVFNVALLGQGLAGEIHREVLAPQTALGNLPDLAFDLITAFRASFFRYPSKKRWTAAEFETFLCRVESKLTKTGKAALELNPGVLDIAGIEECFARHSEACEVSLTWTRDA